LSPADIPGHFPEHFPDYFSGHASDYAEYRPQSPGQLYRFLADNCVERRLAWDCATGNGQAAVSLIRFFDRVVATDASGTQIAAARPHPEIRYAVAAAEDSGLAEASVDLVTVAQALHWFNIDAFLAEATRVLKPGGIVAAWSYEKCSVDADIDPIIERIFAEVENHWPAERRIVENRYSDIDYPWTLLEVPQYSMSEHWRVEQALGYFRTWSASKRYQQKNGRDPISRHEMALRKAWGNAGRAISWPLTVKAGCRP
jgi:ubiquinone/menaquinone biosynthesis C-methylase UbiE